MSHCPECGLVFETAGMVLDHIYAAHVEKVSKLKNQKVEIDGFIFDSLLEGNRYLELKILERNGDLNELELQPRFQILPAFDYNGKRERAAYYVADFQYNEEGNPLPVVEEVKGYQTGIFKLKRKYFLSLYREKYDYRIIS